MAFKTKAEKRAFKIGFNKGKNSFKLNKTRKSSYPAKLNDKDLSKFFGDPRGACLHNGIYYDTNFRNPKPISKQTLQDARIEYGMDSKYPDGMVADRYVLNMRRKYGVFDSKGKFKHLLGDDK